MNRTIRAIIAILFITVITVSGIIICRNLGRSARLDITDQKLYTLSDGTKNIVARLNQPIKLRLFYAKTAATKGPDQIQFFNTYSVFVDELLKEYAAQSAGKVQYEKVDPKPFSDEEEEAIRYGLKKFPISPDENFFFGLVLQTEFGVTKTIPFFSPDRQNFIEYDISFLIDTAITRQKKRIGVLSSLPVMGDDMSDYRAQMMRMQGQQPKPAWAFINHLKQQYEVSAVAADVESIDDVDMLVVVHPKELPDQTLFAIDQFVLKGGRAVVLVDPYCMLDQAPQQQQQMMMMQQPDHSSSSDLNKLLTAWGLEMPADTFAGDRTLAVMANIRETPQKIIGFLNLGNESFNDDHSITGNLSDVRVFMSGVLNKTTDAQGDSGAALNSFTPLISTTNRGNSFVAADQMDKMFMSPQYLNPKHLMGLYTDGSEAVHMGYVVTGQFASAFPDGVELPPEESDDPCVTPEPRQLTGLTVADDDCAVAVFADVDFITDQFAYQQSLFGMSVVGDNSSLVLNAIEDLSGSSDLISIRSRGVFKRPFTVVDEIEANAEKEYDQKVKDIEDRIKNYETELRELVSSADSENQALIASSVLAKRRDLEANIAKANKELRQTNMAKRVDIERLEGRLKLVNMALAPAIILVIAVGVSVHHSARRRRYHSRD